MNYSFFLFSKLFDLIHPIDGDFQELFISLEAYHEQFQASEFNDLYKPEEECMLEFIRSLNIETTEAIGAF